jgi:excisionase family DNA binding protein
MSKASGALKSEVGNTPAVLTLPEAARLLGVGRTMAYQLVRNGQWPTPVVRMGRLIKIPKKLLLDFLGASGGASRASGSVCVFDRYE